MKHTKHKKDYNYSNS